MLWYVHAAFFGAMLLLGHLTGSHKRAGQPVGAVLAAFTAVFVLIMYVYMMLHW